MDSGKTCSEEQGAEVSFALSQPELTFLDLQKLFPKSVIILEIPCNNSAKTRFDSRNVSVNVLRNFASSFASFDSS